jgi:hypothetical protein
MTKGVGRLAGEGRQKADILPRVKGTPLGRIHRTRTRNATLEFVSE